MGAICGSLWLDPGWPLQVLMVTDSSVRKLRMYIGCFGMCILSLRMYIPSLRTEPAHPSGSVPTGIGLNSDGGTDYWGICFVFHYKCCNFARKKINIIYYV